MDDNSVETLNNVDFSFSYTAQITAPTHVLKYRKLSFPKSVSTTFVAHCSWQVKRDNLNVPLQTLSISLGC